MVLSSLDKYRDIGLLILRVGIGIMFMSHGLPKLIAGPDKWLILGGTMNALGIDFTPMAWGFMAAYCWYWGFVPARPASFCLRL